MASRWRLFSSEVVHDAISHQPRQQTEAPETCALHIRRARQGRAESPAGDAQGVHESQDGASGEARGAAHGETIQCSTARRPAAVRGDGPRTGSFRA